MEGYSKLFGLSETVSRPLPLPNTKEVYVNFELIEIKGKVQAYFDLMCLSDVYVNIWFQLYKLTN